MTTPVYLAIGAAVFFGAFLIGRWTRRRPRRRSGFDLLPYSGTDDAKPFRPLAPRPNMRRPAKPEVRAGNRSPAPDHDAMAPSTHLMMFGTAAEAAIHSDPTPHHSTPHCDPPASYDSHSNSCVDTSSSSSSSGYDGTSGWDGGGFDSGSSSSGGFGD